MSENEKTVRYGYSSNTNISFNGTVDTGYTREEWEDLSDDAKNRTLDELIYELVDLFELDDDAPDYTGHFGGH